MDMKSLRPATNQLSIRMREKLQKGFLGKYLFANTASSKLPNDVSQQNCYHITVKKIADLVKFVDQQVIETLWCAELNQC
ncbi:hypothetical protein KIN20_017629 [Parelaphostrongylus tenuis]|uniref:Uncharacterized protein n=1 Tax=Parelaphostrongylus tenuis TaxID=148309 RepID=A0AAD5QRK1_PARTN|nr:hypothetical protein KIN20_017629 [Parelaphostrongylus tenuis]